MKFNRTLLILAALVLLVGIARLIWYEMPHRSDDQKKLLDRSKHSRI